MNRGKLTQEKRAELRRDVEAIAIARDAIPCDKDLERRYGVSRAYIWKLMKAARQRLKSVGKPTQSDVPRNAMLPTSQVSDSQQYGRVSLQSTSPRGTCGSLPNSALTPGAVPVALAGKPR